MKMSYKPMTMIRAIAPAIATSPGVVCIIGREYTKNSIMHTISTVAVFTSFPLSLIPYLVWSVGVSGVVGWLLLALVRMQVTKSS